MHDARQQLLAGAVLAGHQHGRIGHGRSRGHGHDPLHDRAGPDDAVGLEARPDLLAQRKVLADQGLVRALHLFLGAAILDRHRHELRESLEQAAVGVAEHVGAARVVEVDGTHDLAAQEHRHADDGAEPHVDHAVRERARVRGRIADEQRAAAFGDAAHHAPAVADGIVSGGRIEGSVFRDRVELPALRIGQQQHAALGVELLDRHAHRALRQLAQVGERVEQATHRLDQVALGRGGHRVKRCPPQPAHHERQSALAVAVIAQPLEGAGSLIEPVAHRRA